MKILVLSDSHTDISTMQQAVRKEKPDHIIHLGDHARDAEELQREYFNISMDVVKGNNDFTNKHPANKLLSLDGKRIFMTHGDLYGVKLSVDRIIYKGMEEEADVVLFGHTHRTYLNRQSEMWVMNPGSIGHRSSFSSKATYGIIEIIGGTITCDIREV